MVLNMCVPSDLFICLLVRKIKTQICRIWSIQGSTTWILDFHSPCDLTRDPKPNRPIKIMNARLPIQGGNIVWESWTLVLAHRTSYKDVILWISLNSVINPVPASPVIDQNGLQRSSSRMDYSTKSYRNINYIRSGFIPCCVFSTLIWRQDFQIFSRLMHFELD